MARRTREVLKTYFETGDIPTQEQFADLIDSPVFEDELAAAIADAIAEQQQPVSEDLVKTAEYFGAKAVAYGEPPIDNLAAIQTAMDWSSETGGRVDFSHGDYGHDGTIIIRSHSNFLGLGRETTRFVQMDTSWPDCFAPEGAGCSHVRLSGFEINGGWDKRPTFGSGSIWRYDMAAMGQRGLYLTSPDTGANALNRENIVDTYHVITDIKVKDVAGAGIVTGGRGEMFFDAIKVSDVATDGFFNGAVDNWLSNMTLNVCGRRGLVITSGNNRIHSIKSWFVGMAKGLDDTGGGLTESEQGIGIHFSGPGLAQNIGTMLTTQDTWGPGMALEGYSFDVTGQIDEAGGGRLSQQGFGSARRQLPRTCLRVNNATGGKARLAITGTERGPAPNLLDFRNSGASANDIELILDYYRSTKFWNTSAPVSWPAGYTNAKRHNVVRTQTGEILHGMRTDAELADETHGVNLVGKSLGKMVMRSNGLPAWASGPNPADPWVDATGTPIGAGV